MTDIEHVELFHLLFLRHLGQQMASNLYAIKGGCNLRFFFGSIRYSEDLDIDITTIHKQTLQNKINKILSSPALLKLLQSIGIHRIFSTAPKQTDTTQRWKILLHTKSTMPLHTKIEFSRRSDKLTPELAEVCLSICQHYRLPPIALPHYKTKDAITQKIEALAHRSETQARDVFDLYHLLHVESPAGLCIPAKTKIKAMEALLSISKADYQSQVVSYLEKEHQATYGNKKYWELISNRINTFLDAL